MLHATPVVFPLRGKRQIRNFLKRENRKQNNRTNNCGKTVLHATRRIPPFAQQHFSLLIGYVYQCGLQYVHCRDNCGWVFYVPMLVRFIKQCLVSFSSKWISSLAFNKHFAQYEIGDEYSFEFQPLTLSESSLFVLDLGREESSWDLMGMYRHNMKLEN